jgi:threonine dehydratase
VAVKQVGRETFRLARQFVDEMVLVDTDEMCAAIKDVFEDTRVVLEPAGALAIAGAKAWVEKRGVRGKTLVAVACGANTNFDRLRFVAERAEVGEHREAVLAVTIPERRGSFRRFLDALGGRNVTEFNYRMAGPSEAHIFVGVSVHGREETARIVRRLERAGCGTLDLSDNEMAKEHVRHMVAATWSRTSARNARSAGELLYRFEFPERQGALMKFLRSMNPTWNISLFHYRNLGADYGNCARGLQVPRREMGDVPALPRQARLSARRRNPQSGLSLVSRLAIRAAPSRLHPSSCTTAEMFSRFVRQVPFSQ